LNATTLRTSKNNANSKNLYTNKVESNVLMKMMRTHSRLHSYRFNCYVTWSWNRFLYESWFFALNTNLSLYFEIKTFRLSIIFASNDAMICVIKFEFKITVSKFFNNYFNINDDGRQFLKEINSTIIVNNHPLIHSS
jgi:hypothetical protein